MVAGTPSTDDRARGLRELTAGTALFLAVTAGIALASGYLPNPLSRAVVGAVGVSMLAGSIGLEPKGDSSRARARARDGALLGLGAVSLPLLVALSSGGRLRSGELGLASALGVIEALAIAYRDEVWLRGIPAFFGRRANVPTKVLAPFLVATAVASGFADRHASVAGLAMVAAEGAAAAALWLRTRDPWAPVAMHAVWRVVADVLLAGDVFEVEPIKLPTRASAGGSLAWVTALSMTLAAFVAWRWTARADGDARS